MKNKTRRAVFGMPLAIGLLTAAGLFAALLGDDAWDVLAWVGLGIPVAISLVALRR
jgi:hypothetical protein